MANNHITRWSRKTRRDYQRLALHDTLDADCCRDLAIYLQLCGNTASLEHLLIGINAFIVCFMPFSVHVALARPDSYPDNSELQWHMSALKRLFYLSQFSFLPLTIWHIFVDFRTHNVLGPQLNPVLLAFIIYMLAVLIGLDLKAEQSRAVLVHFRIPLDNLQHGPIHMPLYLFFNRRSVSIMPPLRTFVQCSPRTLQPSDINACLSGLQVEFSSSLSQHLKLDGNTIFLFANPEIGYLFIGNSERNGQQ